MCFFVIKWAATYYNYSNVILKHLKKHDLRLLVALTSSRPVMENSGDEKVSPTWNYLLKNWLSRGSSNKLLEKKTEENKMTGLDYFNKMTGLDYLNKKGYPF